MRFSLKWALAAMAYVALAATAFAKPSWIAVELLWTTAILAACYAFVVVCFDRGERQARATAFVFLWLAYIVCILAFPDRLPTVPLMAAAGYELGSPESAEVYAMVEISLPALDESARNAPEIQKLRRAAVGNADEFQAANAVATLFAGLIGCGLGALAYRRGQRESATA